MDRVHPATNRKVVAADRIRIALDAGDLPMAADHACDRGIVLCGTLSPRANDDRHAPRFDMRSSLVRHQWGSDTRGQQESHSYFVAAYSCSGPDHDLHWAFDKSGSFLQE